MTNPVDENDDIENVETADEAVSEADTVLTMEEDIPSDDESKPVKKKILALEARHKIEDYEIEKQLREALDYLDEGKSRKSYFNSAEKKKSFIPLEPPAVKLKEASVKKAPPSTVKTIPALTEIKKMIKPKAKSHAKPKPKPKAASKFKTNLSKTVKPKSRQIPKKTVKLVKPTKKSKKVKK